MPNITLTRGDCLELMKQLPDKSATDTRKYADSLRRLDDFCSLCSRKLYCDKSDCVDFEIAKKRIEEAEGMGVQCEI